MKVARFLSGGEPHWGIVEGESVSVLASAPYEGLRVTDERVDLSVVSLLPPSEPTKVVCVGLNYRSHARELDMKLPAEPVIFLKPPSSVIGDRDAIRYPEGVGRVDHEAELAIVVGKRTKSVSIADARNAVFGYTCLNDVTARDLQKKDGQWTRSKSFDTFCPIGPWIATDVDPSRLRVRLSVNGHLRQDATTEDLIFSPEEIVAFVASIMTLFPGDVIATGTPSGVGPLLRGDRVAVEIDEIGLLNNHVA